MRSLAALAALSLLTAACAGGAAAASSPGSPLEGSGAIRFADVAVDLGIEFIHGSFLAPPATDPVAMMGGGVCWLDYDGDGRLDLFAVNSFAEAEAGALGAAGELPQSALFRNAGDRFENVTVAAGAGVATRGNGCVAADLDGDGHTDLFVTSARFNVLLWNQGDGTFVDGSEAAGVAAYGWHTGAAAGDVDGDGRLDLFVSGYVDLINRIESPTAGFPNTHLAEHDLLYLNQGPGPGGRPVFREVAALAGIEPTAVEYGLGAVLTDMDGDGDLDLYVANDTNPNRLYENVPVEGGAAADPAGLGFRLEERAHAAGVDDPDSGMGLASGDYDGNGGFDLFVTNFGPQTHSLFANGGVTAGGRFDDVTTAFGGAELGVGLTGWGVSWADFDVDTDLDLIVANGHVPIVDLAAAAEPMQLFLSRHAAGDEAGVDASQRTGLGRIGAHNARGLAVADYDDDGDPDVAVNVVGGRLILLRNDGARGHWLVVAPEPAMPGTQVLATLGDGTVLRRELHAGSSYLSSEDPRFLFGLGDEQRVETLEIRWPGGAGRTLSDVPADQHLTVSPP